MKDISSVKIDQSGFVLAVSGGVDSMVLLDIVRKQRQPHEFVVAHLNHGIRSDKEHASDQDVITKYCNDHGLKLEVGSVMLGANASEQQARQARYQFFGKLRKQYDYNIVITAHHKDDVIETAIINILRGTGSKGLVALGSTKTHLRPLLDISKQQVIKYATENSIEWNEDASNTDDKYLRNYIRQNIVPRMKSTGGYGSLVKLVDEHRPKQEEADELILKVEEAITNKSGGEIEIDRKLFILCDHKVATVLVRKLYDEAGMKPPKKMLIEKAVVFMKTAQNNANIDLAKQVSAKIVGGKIIISLN